MHAGICLYVCPTLMPKIIMHAGICLHVCPTLMPKIIMHAGICLHVCPRIAGEDFQDYVGPCETAAIGLGTAYAV